MSGRLPGRGPSRAEPGEPGERYGSAGHHRGLVGGTEAPFAELEEFPAGEKVGITTASVQLGPLMSSHQGVVAWWVRGPPRRRLARPCRRHAQQCGLMRGSARYSVSSSSKLLPTVVRISFSWSRSPWFRALLMSRTRAYWSPLRS